MKYFAVDRQEGKYTILENTVTRKRFEVENSKLPPFLEDGDILKKEGLNYEFDFFKTAQLKREIKDQMNELQK